MSDNRGRGGSRGRGGGRGDFQGGGDRGGFRGGRGGGRGDFRGGGERGGFRGGRGGGDRGDFRGGRGGGDFRGGRGGGDRGGRGDYGGGGGFRGRGGGGGFRGGRGGSYDGEVYGENNAIPQPDQAITALENKWIQDNQLVSKLEKLSLSESSEFFPTRPNFGVKGTQVVVWANYFQLKVNASNICKYTLDITHIQDPYPPKDTTPKKETKPATGSKKAAAGAKPKAKEAKGRKLAHIIDLALNKLPSGSVYASEYKDKVISPKKLNLPKDGIITVECLERNRTEKWQIKFNGPESIHIDLLMKYLADFQDPANNQVFPKYPAETDALGIVMGHTARQDPNAAAVGSSRFFAVDTQRMEACHQLSVGPVTILRGYFQSVRAATGRLLLNTNVTHSIFRREIKLDDLFQQLNLAHVDIASVDRARANYLKNDLTKMRKVLGRTRLRCQLFDDKTNQWTTVDRSMCGLAEDRDGKDEDANRRPKFQPGFPFGCPTTVKFFLREPTDASNKKPGLQYNTYVTVADYYKARYGVQAKAGLPLINVGTPGRPIYLLAEHCTVIAGQPLKTKLSPREQDAMIQFACRPPPSNAKSIATSARALLGFDNNPLLQKFGISVDKQLITVNARELPPPNVAYLRGSVTPENGGWLMKAVKVAKAGPLIKNWTFLYISSQQSLYPQVKAVAGKFAGWLASSMGVNINKMPNPPNGATVPFPGNENELRAQIKQLMSLKDRLQFLLVVLREKDTAIYNTVKKIADVEFGIQTVCVVQDKILQEKGQQGYFANVGLKINLKFGGVNHQLQRDIPLIKSGKTMVVGYDVTHPTNLAPEAAKNAPSIVGLVASIDSGLGQWPATAWSNPQRVEMLDNVFVEKFKSRLQLWQKNNQQRLPENILIFRDGVSEGQFATVLKEELPFIRKACDEMYKAGTKPRISLIVSVKRHQTRFYPTDKAHMHHRSKSPKEGTVVDRGVTNVRYWDFFLQAHASLQGTARPARYTVLLDEIFRADHGDNAANELETLIHDMCYLYGRATKAVSICPPAYYADIVCTRARIHNNELFDDVSDTASVASGTTQATGTRVAVRGIHQNLQDTMYYI